MMTMTHQVGRVTDDSILRAIDVGDSDRAQAFIALKQLEVLREIASTLQGMAHR